MDMDIDIIDMMFMVMVMVIVLYHVVAWTWYHMGHSHDDWMIG